MEHIKIGHLFAGRGEHDGLTGHLPNRQRGTTTGITIKLGQHHTGEIHTITERLGGGHRILADHGVNDEKHLIRLNGIPNIPGLGHEGFINTQPTGGVHNNVVVFFLAGLRNACPSNRDRIPMGGAHLVLQGIQRGSRIRGEGRHARALTNDLQLLDRARALQVAGHQDGGVPLFLQRVGQFAGEGGFTRALQAGKHDDCRRFFGHIHAPGFATKNGGELFVDDFDDLFGRVECLRNLHAEGAFFNAFNKAADNGQGDVGFEQR